MNPDNIGYLEELFGAWTRDPASVTEDWRRYFSKSGKGGIPVFQVIDSRSPGLPTAAPTPDHTPAATAQAPSLKAVPADQRDGMVWKQDRVDSLIWAYRDIGYLYARLNPLVGYLTPSLHFLHEQREGVYERLSPEAFGLSTEDLDREFSAGSALKPGRLRDILDAHGIAPLFTELRQQPAITRVDAQRHLQLHIAQCLDGRQFRGNLHGQCCRGKRQDQQPGKQQVK